MPLLGVTGGVGRVLLESELDCDNEDVCHIPWDLEEYMSASDAEMYWLLPLEDRTEN